MHTFRSSLRSEESIRASGTGVPGSCECWKVNSGPPESSKCSSLLNHLFGSDNSLSLLMVAISFNVIENPELVNELLLLREEKV